MIIYQSFSFSPIQTSYSKDEISFTYINDHGFMDDGVDDVLE
jgi:hypothetical protein